MKKNWKKRSMTLTAVLLLVVFFVTLMPISAFAVQGAATADADPLPDNSTNGQTLTGYWDENTGTNVTVGEYSMGSGSTPGSVNVNAQNASVTTMTGQSHVGTNNGSINQMYAENVVDTNNNTIGTNQGIVTENSTTGTIQTNSNQGGNFGTDKSGQITTNNGTVNSNQALVVNNNGTIETNTSSGKVTNNNAGGTVGEATGTNKNNGTVENNSGTVYNGNNGKVTNNLGGTVNGGTVTNNLGGTVNGGTVTNQYYEIEAEGGTVDMASSYDAGDGKNWAKSGTDATVTFTSEAELKEGDAVSNDNGKTWSITGILSKVKLALKAIVNNDDPAEEDLNLDELQEKANATWAAQIRAAAQGASLTFDAGIWPNLGKDVAKALADRPDVSVTFNTVCVEGGTLVIPAGTDVLGMMGNAIVIGFADIAAKL